MGLLPQATASGLAQSLDTYLEVLVRQTGRLPYRVPFDSGNPAGRAYSTVVPAGAWLLLTVKSAAANVINQSGLSVLGETGVLTPVGSALSPLQFSVQH